MPTVKYGPYKVCTSEVHTGVMVSKDDTIDIKASGDVDFGSGWAVGIGAPVEGPNGPKSGEKAVKPYPGVGFVKNSLIAKIGSSLFQGGFTSKIGPQGPVSYTGGPAPLSLLPNDDRPQDNSRGWEVFVEHTTPDPQATPVPLQIAAIEVVQAIQRNDNSVPRVRGHRTVVRALVGSGGPNQIADVSGVAHFKSISRSGIMTLGSATPMTTSVVARPSPNRNARDDSLNFEVPLNLVQDILHIEVHAWIGTTVPAPWEVVSSCGVDFEARKSQELFPLLITDTRTKSPVPPTPTGAQFLASMQGAVDRYPLADPGFAVPGFSVTPAREISFGGDLTKEVGFSQLLSDVTHMVFFFQGAAGGTRVALVANDGRYKLNGLATSGQVLNALSFVSQADLQGTFAHELAHTHGIWHAPRCTSAADGIDSRLPGGTEDVGFHVAVGALIEQNRGELMSYSGDTSRCQGVTRWPSIATWSILYDEYR